MPPISPPLIANRLEIVYNDLTKRLIDSSTGHVTFISAHDIALLAADLNVATTQLLDLVQCDWRMVIVAAVPIQSETERQLK